jgi:regulator of PEP synthase PpsR (kinase-PPPase family)
VSADDQPAVPVFFLSDSTGISAETMGNALLIQFPDLRFERHLIPFITTVEEARRVVAILDEAMAGPVTPLVFSTTAVPEIRDALHTSTCPLIDFFDLHISRWSPSSASRASTLRPGYTVSATSSGTTPGWRRSSTPWSTTTGRARGPWTRPT